MKKIYLTAEINVVRISNNVIATSAPGFSWDETYGDGDGDERAPERRYRNGRYSADYGFRD